MKSKKELKEMAEDMISSPENVTRDKIVYTTLKMNIPKALLDEFNQIAELQHYSTTEAIKEAMRQFIADQTPDNYENQKDLEYMLRSLYDGILAVTEDPKYKKLGIDPNRLADSLKFKVKSPVVKTKEL